MAVATIVRGPEITRGTDLGQGDPPGRVFDWHRAARILRDRIIVERDHTMARAGLRRDWYTTCAYVIKNSQPGEEPDYSFCLASYGTEADTPMLRLGRRWIQCWISDTPGDNPAQWHAHTWWPESARAIFEGERP